MKKVRQMLPLKRGVPRMEGGWGGGVPDAYCAHNMANCANCEGVPRMEGGGRGVGPRCISLASKMHFAY